MKKFIAVIIAVMMVFSMTFTANAVSFTDTKGHKLESYINRAVEIGFINGYDDGTFRPDQPLTRAQFCKMLCETLGVYDLMNLDFTDVKYEDWYYEHVSSAVAFGFITGFNDNTFRPDDSITRYQAAVMLDRIIELKATTGRTEYTDSASAPSWAADGVKFAASSGYFESFITDTFDGDKVMTRAEAAAVLASMNDSFVKVPVFVSNFKNYGTYVSKNEYTPVGFRICGSGLFAGLGLEKLESTDVDRWVRTLSSIMTISLDNPDKLNFADPGDPPFYSFTYESEDSIAISFYIKPSVSLPAELSLVCELSESSANKYELINDGVATIEYNDVYTFKTTAADLSSMQKIENGKVESYLRFRSNAAQDKLVLSYKFLDEAMKPIKEVYVSKLEYKPGENNYTYVRITDILKKIDSSLSTYGNPPYLEMVLFAPDDDVKKESYFYSSLYFINNKTFDLTHNGKPSTDIGKLSINEAMIIGLEMLDVQKLMSINPDFSDWISMYEIRDSKGDVVRSGFTFTVYGDDIRQFELFSISDLMALNMNNLDTFGQLTVDESVAPGAYTLKVMIGIYDEKGNEAYAEDASILFEVK